MMYPFLLSSRPARSKTLFCAAIYLLSLFVCTSSFAVRPAANTAPTKSAKKRPPMPNEQARRKLFDDANVLYNKGHYEQAAAAFVKLYQAGKWEHFAVLFNLGNAHFRLHRYGVALGYYRKAQRLRPNHEGLLHNIQLLERRVKKNTPSSQTLRAKFLFWYYLLNLKQLFFVVVFLTALTLLVAALHIRRNFKGQQNLRWPVAFFLTLSLVIWTSFGLKYHQERYTLTGIVTSAKITVRSGYGENFEALFLLTETDEVIIKERTAGWLHIEVMLPDEKTNRMTLQSGWIPQTAVMTI